VIINGVRCPRLRKQGNAFYYDHGGIPRRWQPLGSIEAVALRRYATLIGQSGPTPGSVDAMLGDAIEYLRPRVTAGTLANYAGFRKHLVLVFDPDPLSIDQADVLHYLAECPRKSFRGEIGLLSQAFAVWMREGRLRFNPCFGVRCRREGSRRKRLLTGAELDAIIGKADERLAVAIELAYATGLRLGDLCRLRWPDIAGVVQTQKTGALQAYEATADLDALLARAKALQARVASLYVLCNRRGKPWLRGTLRDHWDRACKAAGVEDAHFHDIRACAGRLFSTAIHAATMDAARRGHRVHRGLRAKARTA